MHHDTERKKQTRRRVLKVAAGVIRAEGPDRIAVAGIKRRAAQLHGEFYALFTSEADLVVRAVDARVVARFDVELAS